MRGSAVMSITESPVLAFITEEDRLAVGAGSQPGDPPTMDAAVQQLRNLRAANASAATPEPGPEPLREPKEVEDREKGVSDLKQERDGGKRFDDKFEGEKTPPTRRPTRRQTSTSR
jgi:hypothetical protein